MKRFTIIFTLLALAAGFGGHQAPAAVSFGAPAELAAIDYPEPRAFIETQGWWVQGRTDLAAPDTSGTATDFDFSSVHVHLGVNFPVGERWVFPVSGGMQNDYVAQWHEQIGGASRGVRGGGFQDINSGTGCCTYDYSSKVLNPFDLENERWAGAIQYGADKVAIWRNGAPGVYESRFTADTTSRFGKRQYQSFGIYSCINQACGPTAITARGWYDGPTYTNITMKRKASATTLANGSWYAAGGAVPYSLAQGATRAFAYIDANIHAGTKGIVLGENRTGSTGSFTLPALSPGDHVLLIGGWEKAAAGWNAGVLRLPFHVN
jgi:hypothetical protein